MAYPIGEIVQLAREWAIQSLIGAGGLGAVYAATSRQGEIYALKLIPKDPGADRELLFGDDLTSARNVIPIIDRGEWDDFYVLVMPQAKLSLRAFINRVGKCDAYDAINILVDIAEALVSIEGKVVHRDIKPDNILLLNDQWQLADFGISKYAEATTAQDTRKFFRTPKYAAPEQWRDQTATSATDVYAVGIVAYELLTGQPPFASSDISVIHKQHLTEIPAGLRDVPLPLSDIVRQCLIKAPQARPSPTQLLEQLKTARDVSPPAGANLLQQANAAAVTRQAEQSLQESIAQSEEQRRQELLQAGRQSYRPIVESVEDNIRRYASQASRGETRGRITWRLNAGTLTIISTPAYEEASDSKKATYPIPFDVIACGAIMVTQTPSVRGYEGRSHSLWYCDAQAQGEYRWFEVAFMNNFSGQPSTVPFDLDPSEAGESFFVGMSSQQCAYPFTPIDRADTSAFVDRWLIWLAQVANKSMQYPSTLPELETRGSWRRN